MPQGCAKACLVCTQAPPHGPPQHSLLQVRCTRCGHTGELVFATEAVAAQPSPAPTSGTGAGRGQGPHTDAGGGGGSGGGGSRARSGGTLEAEGECGGCHQAWGVHVAPKLVHERSNTLTHLRPQGCNPVDLLPSLLAGQCGRCAAAASFRAAAVGRWNERACGRCHTLMRFRFGAAQLTPLPAPGQCAGGQGPERGAHRQPRNGSSGAGAAGKGAGTGPLPPGPLPDQGTCRHYRHSYR